MRVLVGQSTVGWWASRHVGQIACVTSALQPTPSSISLTRLVPKYQSRWYNGWIYFSWEHVGELRNACPRGPGSLRDAPTWRHLLAGTVPPFVEVLRPTSRRRPLRQRPLVPCYLPSIPAGPGLVECPRRVVATTTSTQPIPAEATGWSTQESKPVVQAIQASMATVLWPDASTGTTKVGVISTFSYLVRSNKFCSLTPRLDLISFRHIVFMNANILEKLGGKTGKI